MPRIRSAEKVSIDLIVPRLLAYLAGGYGLFQEALAYQNGIHCIEKSLIISIGPAVSLLGILGNILGKHVKTDI